MKANTLRRGMNFWPPFLFAGIKVERISADYREVDVVLRERFFNKNYVGTHFGGSIFAMTDPFFMLMVMNNLSRDYTVWDKSGTVDFLKPGRGLLRAKFRLNDEMLAEIVRATENPKDKFCPTYSVDILNEKQIVVARVTKTLHIRKKQDQRKRIGG